MKESFDNKIVSAICLQMQLQQAAVDQGDVEAVKDYGARLEGFVEGLRCALSSPYVEHLMKLARKKFKKAPHENPH